MVVLEVRNLTKTFGLLNAVDNVSFKVEQGQILVIVGGSGCGKTTTLRCIAGLEDLSGGSILLEGKAIASPQFSLPPEERGIGMVFQSYALWPHKSVKQNVAYGLERKKMSAAEAEEKVAHILNQVGLTGFESRMPSTLSGGQQQRVALARSAILQPKLLLLDEPLSNLDAKLREQMRDELRQMIKMFNMTAVHITHDQSEAMALADSVICMRSGKIEQEGNPRDIYRKPANRYVAEFIGASSFLPGDVVERGQYVVVKVDDETAIQVLSANMLTVDGKCTVAIRPEAVTIERIPMRGANCFEAVVETEAFLGAQTEYQIKVGNHRLKAYSVEDFAVGAHVWISINPRGIVGLEATSANDFS